MLGSGTFGTVSTGYVTGVEGMEGKLIAIKEMIHDGRQTQQAIEQEFNIQAYCNHPNICKVVGQIVVGKVRGRLQSTFGLEYVQGGSLFDYISKNGALDDGLCRTYFN